jgi:rubrerythrin
MLTYETSIADLKNKTLDILIELKDQDLTIEQIVTLKVLNVLKSSFSTYLTVLMKSTRKENKFPNLTDLFQNLADEENRQKAESATINLTRQKEAENDTNESKRENKEINQMKKINQTTKRINASDTIDHFIRKKNARSSISNASNVIKSIIEDLCAESKRRIKMISRRKSHLKKMNSLLQKSH